MRSLLEGLEHNATLKTLDMAYCETDHQGVTLLAQALVVNKTIPVEHIALLYLKLNRFGRRLHAANLLRLALWPAILASMAIKAENTDALFFYI
jgi:hypothetical protein